MRAHDCRDLRRRCRRQKRWCLPAALRLHSSSLLRVIGRAPDATIQLDSPGISRYHARIVVARGEATLEDAGSKNGTRLNARRITTATLLADGDEIRIGALVLVFRIGSHVAATASMPPEGG